MVHDRIAEQVAKEEKEGYETALSGIWGEKEKARAELLGLRGIAYVLEEKGSGRKFRWHVHDLITGEVFEKLHDSDIEKAGFTPFNALKDWAKKNVLETFFPGIERASDYERTWWKWEGRGWVKYEPKRLEKAA